MSHSMRPSPAADADRSIRAQSTQPDSGIPSVRRDPRFPPGSVPESDRRSRGRRARRMPDDPVQKSCAADCRDSRAQRGHRPA